MAEAGGGSRWVGGAVDGAVIGDGRSWVTWQSVRGLKKVVGVHSKWDNSKKVRPCGRTRKPKGFVADSAGFQGNWRKLRKLWNFHGVT